MRSRPTRRSRCRARSGHASPALAQRARQSAVPGTAAPCPSAPERGGIWAHARHQPDIRQWLGYIVQRPESHSLHHARGIHRYNYSDLPLWDVVFGTFRNPKDFMPEAGFDGASSAQIGQMLLFRDIAANDFAQSGRPARHAKA
ncbi:MAG: sterol desaturase family protein [Sinobacteraceae bacterium]|nr:sterol desaturase family protein [Nevskiaceae bacterium]